MDSGNFPGMNYNINCRVQKMYVTLKYNIRMTISEVKKKMKRCRKMP